MGCHQHADVADIALRPDQLHDLALVGVVEVGVRFVVHHDRLHRRWLGPLTLARVGGGSGVFFRGQQFTVPFPDGQRDTTVAAQTSAIQPHRFTSTAGNTQGRSLESLLERDVRLDGDLLQVGTTCLDVVTQGLGVNAQPVLDLVLDGGESALEFRISHVVLEAIDQRSLDGIVWLGHLAVKRKVPGHTLVKTGWRRYPALRAGVFPPVHAQSLFQVRLAHGAGREPELLHQVLQGWYEVLRQVTPPLISRNGLPDLQTRNQVFPRPTT